MHKYLKLFVVTIFVLLMLPFSALADANYNASMVVISNLKVEANNNDKVLVNIYLRGKNNNPQKDTVYIGTNRGEIDKIWLRKNHEWIPVSSLKKENGDKVYYISRGIIEAEVNGKLELGITSSVKGDVKIAVGLKDERSTSQYLSGHISTSEAEIIPIKYKDAPEQNIENRKYTSLELVNEKELATYTENTIEINVLDDKGKVADLADTKNLELNLEIINKPENSQVKITKSPDWQTELKENGSTYVNLYSDKVGEIKIQALFKMKQKSTFLSEIVLENEYTALIKPKQFGAAEIQLYLNDITSVVDGKAKQLTIAPFIENGRTFVPVRFVAEALGAQVHWFAETGSIVLERPDRKVTMNLGSNAVLLDNGKVIISDATPYIHNGTTVLPFRVLGEAFGATVSPGYDANGNIDKIIFINQAGE